MFGFLRRSAPRPLTETISRALANESTSSSIGDPSLLRMVESGGRYSDRKVTYFRIFDPALAARRSLDVRRYTDLDAFQGLIVRSGHVERDGKVILNRAVVGLTPEQTIRTRAGRIVPTAGAQVAEHSGNGAASAPAPVSAPASVSAPPSDVSP